jgi:SAM-dependent methyltransferase
MDLSIAKRILKLNKDFYQSHGESFSESRERPWKGWGRVVRLIRGLKKDTIKVLDLGSGNARFYAYLKNNLRRNFNYLGVEQSSSLRKVAGERYVLDSGFRQQEADVFTELSKVKGLYDVVVAFGLTHHIPSRRMRNAWFKKVASLVKKEGLLILTFWKIKEELKQDCFIVDSKELDQGDLFLGWKKVKGAVRYVHSYTELEINDVINSITTQNFTNKAKFYSDTSNKSCNLYLVFKKH